MKKDRNSEPAPDRLHGALLGGLIALVVARTFVPDDPGGQLGHGAPLDVLWLVLAGAWLLTELRHNRLRLRFAWPDALVVALVLWHTVAAIVAIRAGNPRPAMNMLWDWIAMGLVFFLARQILATQRDARAVVVVMLGLACGMSAVAVHQFFVTMRADAAAYDAAKDSTAALFEQTGQWLPSDSNERMQFEARLESRLPAATFALSNSLAGFLLPWLVMLAGVTLELRRPTTVAVSLAIAALIVACIWLTGSRSAGLAAMIGLLLIAVERLRTSALPRNWRIAIVAGCVAIAAIGVAVAAGTTVSRAALDAAWRSLTFRFEYWRATLAMIKDQPLFGCGPGQFQDTYTAYKLVGAAEEIQDPHNWLLEVWATAGTPAAILLVAMFGVVIVRAFRIDPAADPSSTAAGDSSSVPGTALFGGLIGVVLGTALAWLTGFALSRMHVVLFVVAMVGTWFLFRGWANYGVLPRRLPIIAAAASLVNLLAAGGIGYPAVADSLWLLLAIGLNIQGNANVTGETNLAAADIRSYRVSTGIRWTACLALAAMLAAAIWLEYIPVMNCRLQMAVANADLAGGGSGVGRDALVAATAADPWSAAAASRLAVQRFADYQSLPTSTQLRSLAEADARARQLAPQSAGVWAQSADFAAAIFVGTQDVEYFNAAEKYYIRAIELYPTSAELHSQLARLFQSAGREEQSRDAALEALRLDDAMRAAGHHDRALHSALRNEIETLANGPR